MHRVLLFGDGHWYTLYSYGFMLVVAMLSAIAMVDWRAPRFGLTSAQALDLCLSAIVGGLLGARLFMIVYDWNLYGWDWKEVLNLREGLAYQGAVAGGFLGYLYYCWRTRFSLRTIADLGTPALVVGHMFGRIGCFLGGCCYGKVTHVRWAVTFPDSPNLHFLPRHPTQLYESFSEVLVLFFLLSIEKRLRSGAMFYLYACIYGVERFVIDFFREEPLLYGGLDLAQYLSIGFVLVGLAGLWYVYRAPLAAAPEEAPPQPLALEPAVVLEPTPSLIVDHPASSGS